MMTADWGSPPLRKTEKTGLGGSAIKASPLMCNTAGMWMTETSPVSPSTTNAYSSGVLESGEAAIRISRGLPPVRTDALTLRVSISTIVTLPESGLLRKRRLRTGATAMPNRARPA